MAEKYSGSYAPSATNTFAHRGTFVYDGKRMRKAITRRTIDHSASVIKYLEDLSQPDAPLRQAPYASLLPNQSYAYNLLPPFAYHDSPLNAATTKFVHMSLNKIRCPINVARWTPDAKRVLTGAASGEFTMWNGVSFNFETILQAHDSAIRAMSWSHDGNFLITGDHAGILKFWQPSMNNLKALNAHKEPIRQVTFSPNDSKFASCSDDGTIKIWDFGDAREERALSGHGWDVKTVDWHPNKCLLASGSKDNLVKFWDPKTGANLATLHGHKNTILDLKWNRNGNWLLSSSKDQVIKLFDIRMMRELQTFRAAHKKEINTVCWHPVHENLFASGGAEGAIYFWLASLEREVAAIESAHDGIVWSLDWHPLGHILCSGSSDFSTRFWTRPRPGDSILDRFVLGKQAAEQMGLKPTTSSGNFNIEIDLDEDTVPGLGDSDAFNRGFLDNRATIAANDEFSHNFGGARSSLNHFSHRQPSFSQNPRHNLSQHPLPPPPPPPPITTNSSSLSLGHRHQISQPLPPYPLPPFPPNMLDPRSMTMRPSGDPRAFHSTHLQHPPPPPPPHHHHPHHHPSPHPYPHQHPSSHGHHRRGSSSGPHRGSHGQSKPSELRDPRKR